MQTPPFKQGCEEQGCGEGDNDGSIVGLELDGLAVGTDVVGDFVGEVVGEQVTVQHEPAHLAI